MTWCSGDEVDLGHGVSSCSIDTFESVLALLAGGSITVAYLVYMTRHPNPDSGRLSGEQQRRSAAVGSMMVTLLVGHMVLLIAELMADHTRHAAAQWQLKPSRIFFSASFVMLYLLMALVMFVGCLRGVPIPPVRRVSYGLMALYLMHTMLAVEERNQCKAQSVSVIVPSLQLLMLLGFAVVVTVKCATTAVPGAHSRMHACTAREALVRTRTTHRSTCFQLPWAVRERSTKLDVLIDTRLPRAGRTASAWKRVWSSRCSATRPATAPQRGRRQSRNLRARGTPRWGTRSRTCGPRKWRCRCV
jgi:hypothetical protein